MREVDAQREFCEAVREHAGQADKLSHRFLTGVCDLIVKHPTYEIALLEAKIETITPGTQSFLCQPTGPQWQFLYRYYTAGVPTGMISFAVRGRQFGVSVQPFRDWVGPHGTSKTVRVLPEQHEWTKMGPDARKDAMWTEFDRFMREDVV